MSSFIKFLEKHAVAVIFMVALLGTVAVAQAQAIAIFYEYVSANTMTVNKLLAANGNMTVAGNLTVSGQTITTKKVSAQNANYTVVAATDNGKRFTNTGASAATQFIIPQCLTANIGQSYSWVVDANKLMQLVFNGNDVVNLPTLSQTTKTILTSPITAGASLDVGCYAVGKWGPVAGPPNGTWVSN